jgi:hypothetical protein
MKPIRITLAGLMALIVLAAVGLAALCQPTRFWANATFSLALGLDFAAVVAAIASEGRVRSAWSGFAVCGWGYLLLALFPWFEANVGPQLITTPLIESAYEWINPPLPGNPLLYGGSNGVGLLDPRFGAGWNMPQLANFVDEKPERSNFVPAASYSFLRIAHSLLGIASGMAGGLLALGMARRPDDVTRSTSNTSANP